MTIYNDDTICAISTPAGSGGIAVIRVSGAEAFAVCDNIFAPRSGKPLSERQANTVVYGSVNRNGEFLDDVLATVFRAPHSFTGENTVEISCHGSLYIQQEMMKLLIDNGARQARPGEYTQRAFMNGKMDLSQAEAVADLIASTSAGMHRLAVNQMRGGFSDELKQMRTQLLDFTSLIELELDFGDHEELEFADRTKLKDLAKNIQHKLKKLANSFAAGNVIKNGIPVAIIGKPNVGKSTLLNALLNEDRAIVSDIPGTTRDTIEETLCIQGQLFRFIDTAGLRDDASDSIEALGIKRSFDKAEKAAIIIYLFDLTQEDSDEILRIGKWLQSFDKPFLMIGTKNDLVSLSPVHTIDNVQVIHISCKEPVDVDLVKGKIVELANVHDISQSEVIVTNVRHYEALCHAGVAIERVLDGLDNNLSGDFISQDLRECIFYLNDILGEVTTDDVLKNIFSKFCIGK